MHEFVNNREQQQRPVATFTKGQAPRLGPFFCVHPSDILEAKFLQCPVLTDKKSDTPLHFNKFFNDRPGLLLAVCGSVLNFRYIFESTEVKYGRQIGSLGRRGNEP